VPGKNIQNVSTDDQAFKVQSFTTIQQVLIHLKEKKLYIFIYIIGPKGTVVLQ